MNDRPNPCETLDDIRDLTGLLAFFVDIVGFSDSGHDMSPSDFRGLHKILMWMQGRIEEANTDIQAKMEAAEIQELQKLGLPEHAMSDEHGRKSWRHGFTHGLAHGVARGIMEAQSEAHSRKESA